MKSGLNARGYTAVRNKYGEISHTDVGGGEPLADVCAAPPFKIEYSIFGDGEDVHGDAWSFEAPVCRSAEGEIVSEYLSRDGKVAVTVTQCPEEGLYTQTVCVRNLSGGKLCVKQLYNFFNGIDTALFSADYAQRMRIGVLRSEWGAEGQLYWLPPDEVGVIRPTGHKTGYTGELCSPTSLTTKRYMPVVFFQDLETHHFWFVQHLPDGPYCIEIGLTDRENVPGSCLNVGCGAGTSERHGFRLYLAPGESYACSQSAAGCADSFDGCVAALTNWRRKRLRAAGCAPFMFNDYMNCLWTKLDDKVCASLIDTAAALGAEGYCFDDGWYREPEDHGLRHLGDWTPAEKRFGSGGLQALIDRIRDRGMIAGLWTELEVCSLMSDACKLDDDCFLHNEGHRIFRSNRLYFNLASAGAQEYLMDRIARLYAMGVRYLKNDYNGHPGSGVDWPNASAAAGLEQHMRAVNAFYARVRERFPDLYLENCSSGAMRADGQTNRSFHLQSVSDCEEYEKMPSIVCGTLLGLVPEQTGVWVYPYPRIFWEMNGEQYLTDEYRQSMADGEQTIFNMASGMCGAMYLSGKLDRADEANLELVQSGVRLYKSLRPFLCRAVPFYPLPLPHITDRGFAALGLRAGEEAIVTVWRKDAPEDTAVLPLPGVCGIEEIYPCRSIRAELGEDAVTVTLPKARQAAVFRVKFGA